MTRTFFYLIMKVGKRSLFCLAARTHWSLQPDLPLSHKNGSMWDNPTEI